MEAVAIQTVSRNHEWTAWSQTGISMWSLPGKLHDTKMFLCDEHAPCALENALKTNKIKKNSGNFFFTR